MSKSVKILDLGIHPFADTFIKKKQLNLSEPIFPLECYLDTSSFIIYNSIKTNEIQRYNLYDYSYTSSNSSISKNYWKEYFKAILKNYELNTKSKILEIGSNDGYLINLFKKKTNNILGVDASNHMTQIANKKKIRSINMIFNNLNSKHIKKKYGKFDLIIANNVLNHSNDPLDFVKGVENILSKNGCFIFELPYWYELVRSKRFDQIYHEHVSYLTAKSSYYLLKKYGLQIEKIEMTPYHGGSIRVHAKKSKKVQKKVFLKKIILIEERSKLFEIKTYKNLMLHLQKKKINFLKKIINYKSKNYTIVGIGAAAKANTFLNFIGLNNSIIDFITDASKYKIGKYTPLTRIPIFSDKKLGTVKKKICAIPLAWNISNLLKNKIKKINKKIKFINF